MRVASAPAYPLDLDMYQSGVPSSELAALARSTSYPPPTTTNGSVPHRPATAAAMAHYQPRPAYAPHDSHMSCFGAGSGQAAGYPYVQAPGSVYPPPSNGPQLQQQQPTHFPTAARPPATPRSASAGRGPTFPSTDATFSYWGLHNSSTATQTEFSPTSSSPSATSAGEFAAKKRAAAAASASSSMIKSSESFEQYSTSNGGPASRQQQQQQQQPPKGFLLLDDHDHQHHHHHQRHVGPAITTATEGGSGGFCGFPY